jgi:hypothetical protein
MNKTVNLAWIRSALKDKQQEGFKPTVAAMDGQPKSSRSKGGQSKNGLAKRGATKFGVMTLSQ